MFKGLWRRGLSFQAIAACLLTSLLLLEAEAWRKDAARSEAPLHFVTLALTIVIGIFFLRLYHQVRRQPATQSTRTESEEHFRTALDAGRLATWEQDLVAGTATRSPRAQEIYGISADAIDTPGKWLGMVHPDDRERVGAMISAAKERRGVYEAEFRFRRGDGQERWIMTSGSIFHDASGAPVRAAGVIQDVTDRREAENAVREREALNRSIIDAAPNGMLIVNAAGAIMQANIRAERMFGYASASLGGEPIAALIPGHGISDVLMQKPEAGIAAAGQACVGWRRDGSEMPLEIFFSPIETRQGRIVVASIIDISLRKAAERTLQLAKEEAESATRAKSEFLASMSHEIRTPLNGIIGFAELLLDGELSGTQRRQVMLVKDSGASLLAIINDILDVSKIEAGKLELECIAMSPVCLVDGAMSIIRA